ncbi:MAG: S-layer homology domain-containing protein, partial [Butyrivibrio hungatei]|nr:S-layer homology domain-containing protein [Butyrivibrio hungatei]
LYNCCAFAPDGTLMVGSSTNHIYCYDISNGDFKQIKKITCDDVASINNLNYIQDGTLFISTDSGVSYMDKSGYHRLNTNDFNNSIDNMLYDYQGNLWFTSSRLGLLRLAKSPFKDVSKTHAFYKAILWGSQEGITKGYTTGEKKGTFGINDNCTRGQIVTFLYRAR